MTEPACTMPGCPCTTMIASLRERIKELEDEVAELEAETADHRERPGDVCRSCGKGKIDERYYCDACGHDAQDGDA